MQSAASQSLRRPARLVLFASDASVSACCASDAGATVAGRFVCLVDEGRVSALAGSARQGLDVAVGGGWRDAGMPLRGPVS